MSAASLYSSGWTAGAAERSRGESSSGQPTISSDTRLRFQGMAIRWQQARVGTAAVRVRRTCLCGSPKFGRSNRSLWGRTLSARLFRATASPFRTTATLWRRARRETTRTVGWRRDIYANGGDDVDPGDAEARRRAVRRHERDAAEQGISVSLSADGNTLVLGGSDDGDEPGRGLGVQQE